VADRMPRWFGAWLHRRGTWQGGIVVWGSDEWGRRVLTVRLVGERGLSIAYRWCLCPDCRQRCRCGLVWAGWTGGQVMPCYGCGAQGPSVSLDDLAVMAEVRGAPR
jgi:hypothetical protein